MKQIYHNTGSDFTKDLQNYNIDKKARERADEWIKWRDEKIKEYQQ